MMSSNSDVVDGGASITNAAHSTLGGDSDAPIVVGGVRIYGYYLDNRHKMCSL